MLKALLILATRNMTSSTSGRQHAEPEPRMGAASLGQLLDGTSVAVYDQTRILAATGESFSFSGSVADSAKPLRIVLAWSDAPGSTTSASYVNNLDLEVKAASPTAETSWTTIWSPAGTST